MVPLMLALFCSAGHYPGGFKSSFLIRRAKYRFFLSIDTVVIMPFSRCFPWQTRVHILRGCNLKLKLFVSFFVWIWSLSIACFIQKFRKEN